MAAKNLVNEFLITIDNKKKQFILLSMERIKEEDKEYLKTLSNENLLKLKDNIKKYCDNIYIIDNNIIKICKEYNKLKLEEEDIKIFNFYSDMNDEINSYLKILMLVPLDNNFINDDIKTFLNNEKPLEPKKSSLSKSHSFSSKSSNSPHSFKNDDIYETNLEKYSVIKTFNNQNIFLNAIFDYCLYTNNINNIYSRLIAIERIINNKFLHKYNIIKSLYGNENFEILKKDITTIYGQLLSDNKIFYYQTEYENESHTLYQKKFIKYIMLIYSLYTYTYGYKKFEKDIKNILNTDNTKELLLKNEYLSTYKKIFIIDNYFSKEKKDINENDMNEFILNYLTDLINSKYNYEYDDKDFVDCINNILFKKIKKNKTEEYIPRFYLLLLKEDRANKVNKVNFKFYKKKFRENFGKYIYITIYINDKNDYSLIIPKNNPSDINEKVAYNKEEYRESPSSSSKEYV